MTEEVNRLYRYNGFNGAPIEELFRVKKHTPKGVWIDIGPGYPEKLKFVLLSGRRRYAYPTKEQALDSFIQRKEWHLVHLDRQTKNAEHALAKAKEGLIGYAHQRKEVAESMEPFYLD